MNDCAAAAQQAFSAGFGFGTLFGAVVVLVAMWAVYYFALRMGLFPGREDSSEPLGHPGAAWANRAMPGPGPGTPPKTVKNRVPR